MDKISLALYILLAEASMNLEALKLFAEFTGLKIAEILLLWWSPEMSNLEAELGLDTLSRSC